MRIRYRNYVKKHGYIYEFSTLELLVDYVESTIIAGLLCENIHCRKIKKLKNGDYSLTNRSRNILEIAMQNSSKISEIRCQNGTKIHLKSIKIPSKHRGPKKDGLKSSKIEPLAPKGRKRSLRLSRGPSNFGPGGPYKPRKRTRIVFM